MSLRVAVDIGGTFTDFVWMRRQKIIEEKRIPLQIISLAVLKMRSMVDQSGRS